MNSPIPLYHQVFSVLRQRIVEGEYAEGERLPPEDELGASLGVSRATVRQALGELARIGLVSREQGRGTFVRRSELPALGQVFGGSLADLMAETRRAGLASVEIERRATLPAWVLERLGVEEPRGTVVRRVRTMDGDPFAYTINYLPDPQGRPVTEAKLRRSGMMALLQAAGVKIGSATQSVRAESADVRVSEALGVDLGAPVLSVERVLAEPDGAPIELVRSWYRGDRYAYTVTFRGDDGGGADIESRLA